MPRVAILILSVGLFLFPGTAKATFHLWRINEVFSNADGTVQFIELTAFSSGQQFIGGHTITSQQGTQVKTYSFPSNLPGDTADGGDGYDPYSGIATSFKSFLIGTRGFAALGGVAPDYIVPDGFLFRTNGTLNFADVDVFSYTALPANGTDALDRNGSTRAATPKNFEGIVGSIRAATPGNYSDLWWAGASENGWGMTVQQHGNTQFNVFFVYDAAGKPVWYVMPGGSWDATQTSYSGPLFKPVSAPLNNYNPAAFAAGSQAGTMTINYTGSGSANLQYTIDGKAGAKSIQRQEFGAVDNTAGLQVGDMWWAGTAQNGWGVSITQQYRTLFAAWYSYDAAGNTTWFTMPGGSWNGNTFSGVLATANSSPWLGVPYVASQFAPVAVGSVSFTFQEASNATMNYSFTSGPFAGTTQTRQLVRQPY